MSGDYSRDSFDALRDYAGVFLQQGRAVLDSDWNEMVEMFERRIRTGTVDTIGRAAVPRETIEGFEIRFAAAGGLEIGRGRKYLDGMLLECHGSANFTGAEPALPDPVFDRGRPNTTNPTEDGPEGVLNEMIPPPEGDFLNYLNQPYWPEPDPLVEEGTAIAYVVAWQREITPIEMPDLLEPAMGGIDTTTRWQTVWQVRTFEAPRTTTCTTPDQDIPGWQQEIAPSTARLTTATVDIEDPEDPCLVPPTEGYSGIENQFYRVELHSVGETGPDGNPPTQTDARFKFSRENASVVSAVESISSTNDSVFVGRIGRDEILRFREGDWVELTDDRRELNHGSGEMLRVAHVFEDTREIELESAISDPDLIPSGVGDDTTTNRRTRLIRWDQQGVIRLPDGTDWVDLNAPGSDGLIPVPPPGTALVLENGITVEFSTAPGQGRFREMDHWRFAARTAGTQIEELRDAPPDGIQRHYCRLAVVRFGTPNTQGSILDCRTFWPPQFEAGDEGCYCTVCVTAEEHNSGTLTIQQAIDQIPDAGGTVCLEAGNYILPEPIIIANRNALKVSGQGLGTILLYQGAGGAIQIDTANDIQLERFTVFAFPGEDPTGNIPIVHGIAAENTTLLALRRLAVLVASPNPEDRFDFGIALDGVQIGIKIEECVIVAPHALGSRSTYGLDEDGDLTFAAFAELRVLDCILFGGRVGILIDRVAFNISAALLSRNLVFSNETGIRLNWFEIPAGSLSIETSTVVADRTGLRLGATTTRVQDCEISGGDGFGDGIRLVANIAPETLTDAQLIGNTIFDFAGAGIRIDGQHDTVLIKRNIIRDVGIAGIATDVDASIRHLAIDNNAIEGVAQTGGAETAMGIAVNSVESGQIIGNSIRDVGEESGSGQAYSGIYVQGSGSVDVSSNVLSEIGSDGVESSATGILVRPPYLGITVTGNRIFGDLDGGEGPVNWTALDIGSSFNPDNTLPPVFTGEVARIPSVEGATLAYFAVDNQIYRASTASFAIALPNVPGQITATGNQMRTGREIFDGLIRIVDGSATGVSLSNNVCDHSAEAGLDDMVLISSPRISVSGNTVTHRADALTMRLFTGEAGAATVIGNITTGRILLNGSGLPAPFGALNLQA